MTLEEIQKEIERVSVIYKKYEEYLNALSREAQRLAAGERSLSEIKAEIESVEVKDINVA